MKPKIFAYLFIVGFVLMLISAQTPQDKFYYAFEEKVTLVAKMNTILVKYLEGVEQTQAVESLERLSNDFKIKWHGPLTAEISTGSQRSTEELTAKLKQDNKIYTCQPYYTLKNGLDMGVTDEILVRFLPEVTEEQQKELQKALKVKVVKTTKIYQKLRVSKGGDALKIANKYYESEWVEFATPNFISYAKLHQVIPNDTYFDRQIALHNTGQVFTDGHSGTNDADIDAPEAWEITSGCSDIVIAVIDEGVTPNHPDLPNTRQLRLRNSDFWSNDSDPSPNGNDNHGNACAGVIAATMNNNQGIAGISPNCRIMPIRCFNHGSGVVPSGMADAIEFAVDNGAHILSNSWGYGDTDQNLHPVIVSAINYAVNNNCVVVFAAGNNADHDNNDNGYVEFPANVNISSVITVGASDRNDDQANYSPTSSLIDIVAPSNRSMPWQDIAGETYEMWTIDIPDSAGYNVWHGPTTPPSLGEVLPATGTNHLAYTARFGGTSHACPVVAGVAALMLSVNPNLSN